MATADLAIEALTAQLAEAAPADGARVGVALAEALLRRGDTEDALARIHATRRAAEAGPLRAELDRLAAEACLVRGELDQAFAFLDDAARPAAEAEPAARALLTLARAAALRARGDHATAQGMLEEARVALQAAGRPTELSRCLRALAELALSQGRRPEAQRLVERAIEEARAGQDPLEFGRVQVLEADLAMASGELRAARRRYRRALAIFEQHGFQRDLAEAYLRFGVAVGELNLIEGPDASVDPAAVWVARAQELFRARGTLTDLERVREAFRRFGRRATDRAAGLDVAPAIEEFQGARKAIVGELGRFADAILARVQRVARKHPELGEEIDAAREEVDRLRRFLALGIDALAGAEGRLIGALHHMTQEREKTRTLLELSRQLSELGDPARVVEDAARMIGQLTGADRTVLAEWRGGELVARARQRFSDADQTWRVPLGRAVAAGAPILVERDEESPNGRQDPEDVRLGVAMAVPLRHGADVVGGVFVDKALCGGSFTERDLELCVIFCAQLATILENTRITQALDLEARQKNTTLDAITDGVVLVSAEGVIVSCNRIALRMLGLPQLDAVPLVQVPGLAFLKASLDRGEDLDGRVVRIDDGEYVLNLRGVQDEAGKRVAHVVTLQGMKRAARLAQRIVGSGARFSLGDVIGGSTAIRRCVQIAAAAARSDSSVLVTGESGTGKEVLAQAIHNAGARAQGPFVGINCAAIPRELLESELFGYEAGAFTGAKRGGHPGKFELADGGTLLLDEIGDMPLDMQAKLLRVLQERSVTRVGGAHAVPFDTRIIATTNRDLGEDAQSERFRQDLYFRLRVIHVELPPLRERPEDIRSLIDHFLQLFSARTGRATIELAPPVLDAFLRYPWPGNIRELEHVLEAEISLAPPGDTVLRRIPHSLVVTEGRRKSEPPAFSATTSLEEAERALIVSALTDTKGDVLQAARRLGISRGTVYNKMARFGLAAKQFRERRGAQD